MDYRNIVNQVCFYGKMLKFKDKSCVELLRDRLKVDINIVNNPNIDFLKYMLIYVEKILLKFVEEELAHITVEIDSQYDNLESSKEYIE